MLDDKLEETISRYIFAVSFLFLSVVIPYVLQLAAPVSAETWF